jgi:Zn-dependent protease with chaperone function
VTAALLLFIYATAVSVAGPALLARADWVARSPRLGVAAWLGCTASVVTAFLVAVAVPAVVPAQTWRAVCDLWQICVDTLRGAHGWTATVIVVATAGLFVAALGRLASTCWRLVPAMARTRRRHLETVYLVGRRTAIPDVTVIDHSHPAAYVIGARHPVVVITSGAVQRLSDAELGAVIAHERAHAAGRHHLLIAVLRVLSEAFPASKLFRQAHLQVAQLVEVCADDVAVRRHARLDLARALVTVAEGSATNSRVPSTVLAVSGGHAATRLQRLLHPPRPSSRRVRWPLAAAVVALPALPLSMLALAHTTPMLAACPPLLG